MAKTSKVSLDVVLQRINNGESVPKIAASLGVHKNTIRHLLKVNNCKRTVTVVCVEAGK